MKIKNFKIKLNFLQRLYIFILGCPHPAGITMDEGKSFLCGICKKTMQVNDYGK